MYCAERCREVNSWWKKIIDSDKTIAIRKIQYCIGLSSNDTVKKTLQRSTSKFLKELVIFVKEESGHKDWPKSKHELFFHMIQIYSVGTTSCGKGMYLWKILFDNIDNKDQLMSDSDGFGSGKSALFHAAFGGNLEACRYIMEHVKELKPESDGNTAFHVAIDLGRYEVCKYFIEELVDLNINDHIGRTPLDYAKEQNEREIVKLIEASVNLNNLA